MSYPQRLEHFFEMLYGEKQAERADAQNSQVLTLDELVDDPIYFTLGE